MIKSEFLGMELDHIPTENFDTPFETWSGALPSLVLASVLTVPSAVSSNWRLAFTEYGGHRCYRLCAPVLLLNILPEMMNVVRVIADADFTGEYLGYFESLPQTDHAQILDSYSRYLASAGLTCSEANLQRSSQDLYPLDASPANLLKLSGPGYEPELGCGSDSLVLYISGPSDFPAPGAQKP